MIIAVDGPTASGKGTIARALAAHLSPQLEGRWPRSTGTGDPDENARKAPVTWRKHVAISLLFFAGCSGTQGDELSSPPSGGGYQPSLQQKRVDRSFSDIPIESPLVEVEGRLMKIIQNDCERWAECEWRDAEGVRHYFFNDVLAIKTIDPADFNGRPIPALGIGHARDRERVLEAVRQFLPKAELDCSSEGEADGSEHCIATLRPGWLTIAFDASGSLTEVKLDGYHFT